MGNVHTGLPWDHPYWADRITPREPVVSDPPVILLAEPKHKERQP